MSNAIRIDDLAHPRLTDVQRAAMAYGEQQQIDFSEAAVLAAARQRTGLTDFGPEDFRERLRLLLGEWGNDPDMTGSQRANLFGYLVRYASNRLLIQDQWQRHPGILEQEIRQPLIVAGLPRSGTTHLL
ncbi:MAG: sulfotransferase, partial [Haliea sp.]